MDERINLLPPNATPLEVAIAAVDGRLDDIDMDLVRRVKSVWEAPEWALPYLAWERSVDVWSNAWSVQIKRQVIDVAPEVHRLKGTVYAVETALGAIGIEAEFTEWWQKSPKGEPSTWELTAWATEGVTPDDPIFTPQRVKEIIAVAKASKPASRSFTFRMGIKWKMNTYASLFTRNFNVVKFEAENGMPRGHDCHAHGVLICEPLLQYEFKSNDNGVARGLDATVYALATTRPILIYKFTTEN